MTVILIGLAMSGYAVEPEKPRLVVSVSNLGGGLFIGGKGGQGGRGFGLRTSDLIKALQADGWCSPREAPTPHVWYRPPAGVDPNQWVSVTVAGFGKNGEVNAWVFDGPGGAARRVAHVPFQGLNLPDGRAYWRFSTRRLVLALRAGWTRDPAWAERPTLGVRVNDMKTDEPTGLGGLKTGHTPWIGGSGSVSVRDGLAAVEALVWSAAWQNGWTPERADNATACLTLAVRGAFRSLSIHATLDAGDLETTRAEKTLPEDALAPALIRMLTRLKRPRDFTDFQYIGTQAELLYASRKILVCNLQGMGRGIDPLTGGRIWPPVNDKTGRSSSWRECIARVGVDGERRIYRRLMWGTRDTGVERVEPESGSGRLLLPARGTWSWSFDINDDDVGALALGPNLHVYVHGKERWTHEEGSDLNAGPQLINSLVLAGNDCGELTAWNLSDGGQKWRTRLAPGLLGPIVEVGERVLVFSAHEEKYLAVDPATGRVQWTVALGDRWLNPPMEWAGHILLTSQGNRLLLVRADDGSVVGEYIFNTWPACVVPAPRNGEPLLLCAEIDGRVTWLEGTALRPAREILLPSRLLSGVAAGLFPTRLGVGSNAGDLKLMFVDNAPAVILSDQEGFIYVMPIEARSEQ